MRHKNLRSVSRVRRDYDQDMDNYDRIRFGTPGGQYVDKKEQEFVASVIKDSRVLEVGTATGRFAVALTGRGSEYTGVDLSRMMLRETRERTNQSISLIQMDGCQLGFRSYFNYVLCIRTFHFLSKPVEALSGMYDALEPSGKCIVTFETDNFLRRVLLLFGIGTSEQYYYKISDVKGMFLRAGFTVAKSGSVMRIPVTVYRRCPRLFVPLLGQLEKLWCWPMHGYVLGSK